MIRDLFNFSWVYLLILIATFVVVAVLVDYDVGKWSSCMVVVLFFSAAIVGDLHARREKNMPDKTYCRKFTLFSFPAAVFVFGVVFYAFYLISHHFAGEQIAHFMLSAYSELDRFGIAIIGSVSLVTHLIVINFGFASGVRYRLGAEEQDTVS